MFIRTITSNSSTKPIFISRIHSQSFTLPFQITDPQNVKNKFNSSGLIDSGAGKLFIDKEFAKEKQLSTYQLERPIPVFNVDGTKNSSGYITHATDLIIKQQNHLEMATFLICDLGSSPMILGLSWLQKHNPTIDWQKGTLQFLNCPPICKSIPPQEIRHLDDRPTLSLTQSLEEARKKIPPQYHEYIEIFDKLTAT